MGNDTTFDRLTRALSASERAELLKRVRDLGMLPEPGFEEEEEDLPPSAEPDIMRLGLLSRIVLFFMSLFTGRPKSDVMRDMASKRLGDEIVRLCPGLLDTHRSVFLVRMRDEIDSLATALAPLREPLRRALGDDQEEFLAFLAGHLLPHVQVRLAAATLVSAKAEDLEAIDIAELRRRVHEDLENALASMPEEERRLVYSEAQAFHRLRGLVGLPFPEMTEGFEADAEPGECPFARLKKHLPALDAQTHALRRPPSASAIEGLFMFWHRDEIGNEEFDLEARLTEDLGKASAALAAIRSFAQRVPLTRAVRFATGNLSYVPRVVGGGEDWFILFKRYWTSRSEAALKTVARTKERARLRSEAEEYLGVHRLPRLGTDAMAGVALEVATDNSLALELVLGFSQEVFIKLSRSFSMLIERARFAKEENRRELAQVCAYLNGLDGRVDALMSSLRADAELRQQPEDRETAAALRQRATRVVSAFLDECAGNVKILTNVLEGILRGAPGGRYDTVFNLDTVGDWQGRMMSEVLEEGYDRIVQALTLLGRIRGL